VENGECIESRVDNGQGVEVVSCDCVDITSRLFLERILHFDNDDNGRYQCYREAVHGFLLYDIRYEPR